jgi:membrane protein
LLSQAKQHNQYATNEARQFSVRVQGDCSGSKTLFEEVERHNVCAPQSFIMEKKKSVWILLKTTAVQWFEDQPFQLSSSLAYYTLFSLAPLLIIVIAIAGLVFGQEAAQQQIVGTIQGMVGQQSAEAVQGMIQNASSQPNAGMISAAIGFIALILGAGGVVGQLQTALNTIWGVEPKPGQGIWGFLRQRFVSYAMLLGIGFLLLVSLVVSAVAASFTQFLGSHFGGAEVLAHGLDLLISFLLITVLFAMIYKYLPDVRIEWRDVWIGAALTSVLFTIGKVLIGLYLGRSGVSSTFGAAGSLITVLLWVYYSGLIFFLGAEFTQVYASQYGSGVAPAANAEPIDPQKRQTPPPEKRTGERRSPFRKEQNRNRSRRAGS